MEEEKLPVVNSVQSDRGGHKILLRSPWEIIESPAGPGAIFSPLSSHKIVDNLNAMDVQYVQVEDLLEPVFLCDRFILLALFLFHRF